MSRFTEDIQITQNVRIVVRERGKIVTTRNVHNVFVDLGREWLVKLMSYKSFSPDVPQRDDRVRYMGFGIGGNRQLSLLTANSSPLGGPGDPYAANSASGIGANNQSGIDNTITALERPVRISGSSAGYPGVSGDIWLGTIQAPAVHNTATSVTYTRVFTSLELSYLPFATVPLSEVGLYTSTADPGFYLSPLVAYNTFDTISKTSAINIEVDWTFNLG